MEEDLHERIMILNERRSIIETLKYSDKHRKLLNSVLLDKLKLDREFELEDEMVGAYLIKGYKAIKGKGDPRVFMLPIRLKGKYNYRALVDTESNINMMPYRIYELLGRDEVKTRSDNVRMLDHSSAETMRCLLDVLCQVGVTNILANVMLLDVPMDRDVPIIVGRIFLYTCGAIMNIIKGTMSTFDVSVHQQFNVSKVRALPVPLKNTEWAPNYSNNTMEDGDGKRHAKIRVTNLYRNVFEQGYETKETTREMSRRYKLSDIMSPNWH
nr:hypothetical protein [Tanacetum cinerariifolium]